jgi:hypothetical protein
VRLAASIVSSSRLDVHDDVDVDATPLLSDFLLHDLPANIPAYCCYFCGGGGSGLVEVVVVVVVLVMTMKFEYCDSFQRSTMSEFTIQIAGMTMILPHLMHGISKLLLRS